MNRTEQKLRMTGGLCVLLNLVAFFLPLTVLSITHFGTFSWSGFTLLKAMFREDADLTNYLGGCQVTGQTGLGWVLLLIALPLILACVSGIWCIVGGGNRLIRALPAVVAMALYLGLFFTVQHPVGVKMPVIGNAVLNRGYAGLLHLIFTAAGAVLILLSVFLTQKETREDDPQVVIPEFEEIRQQQIEERYSIIAEEAANFKREPKGIMRGLTGIYAGAEIPFQNGEWIKLGRMTDSDLIFDGQKKVSRNHCRIRWEKDRNMYTIVDYSSNGTFANGSADCLPQNMPIELPPGTDLAIGDAANVFRLE